MELADAEFHGVDVGVDAQRQARVHPEADTAALVDLSHPVGSEPLRRRRRRRGSGRFCRLTVRCLGTGSRCLRASGQRCCDKHREAAADHPRTLSTKAATASSRDIRSAVSRDSPTRPGEVAAALAGAPFALA